MVVVEGVEGVAFKLSLVADCPGFILYVVTMYHFFPNNITQYELVTYS